MNLSPVIIDDEFCPEGHYLVKASSHIVPVYFYCETCNKAYVPTIVEYVGRKEEELIETGKVWAARSKVSYNDLKKLGYV